ncbi:peptidase S26 [Ignicoccus islandicus DSM 13165]|uniref:Signal peptidase I n=1 Tax=Ignicoccus islandicus DSM 13165 TaxID=940295 RepID=A0A0U3EBT2_9CREN|nr:signal peptidase I [Ignicoccus islandicus]ALU11923.1 peptidase S26 [Ignicoccus islandicus DSM 13165]
MARDAKKEAIEWGKAIVEAVVILTVLKFLFNTEIPIAAVASGSMLPTLERGDLVIVIGSKPENIKVGDIIVYHSCQGPYIIHRVIKVVKEGSTYYFVTKGDNNPGTDWWLDQFVDCKNGTPLPGVPQGRVAGKVLELFGHPIKIPYLGYVALIAFPFLWWVPR